MRVKAKTKAAKGRYSLTCDSNHGESKEYLTFAGTRGNSKARAKSPVWVTLVGNSRPARKTSAFLPDHQVPYKTHQKMSLVASCVWTARCAVKEARSFIFDTTRSWKTSFTLRKGGRAVLKRKDWILPRIEPKSLYRLSYLRQKREAWSRAAPRILDTQQQGWNGVKYTSQPVRLSYLMHWYWSHVLFGKKSALA
jgi:hypothetical protein